MEAIEGKYTLDGHVFVGAHTPSSSWHDDIQLKVPNPVVSANFYSRLRSPMFWLHSSLPNETAHPPKSFTINIPVAHLLICLQPKLE